MHRSLVASVIFTSGVALGILLMPDLPELGAVVIYAACSAVLISWVCQGSR
jgi:hypothetical protein